MSETATRAAYHRAIAIALFAPSLLLAGMFDAAVGRPGGWLALLMFPLSLAGLRRPALLGAMALAAGAWLRVVIVQSGPVTDQIETTQAALRIVLTGGNPYGHPILGTSTGAAFPYGPLSLVAYAPGVWTEVAAGVITLGLLWYARAWVSLVLYATFPLVLRGTVMGMNDVLPGCLIAIALLDAAHVRRSALVLALATAVKPYAAAWVPGLVGYGGLEPLLIFTGASAVAWSPLLLWGPGSYLRSIALAEIHRAPQNALDLPGLRVLAVPIGLLALRLRSWQALVWSGVAIFLVVLFLARWASLGYLLAVLPVAAIAGEEAVARRCGASTRPLAPLRPAPQSRDSLGGRIHQIAGGAWLRAHSDK